MVKKKPYNHHLKESKELETPHEETRAGFLSVVFEKNRQAIPFIEEAKALKTAASRAEIPKELLKIGDIRLALLAAAGLSDKAMGHLTRDDQNGILENWVKEVLEPQGSDFVDELVYRFLLTKGDALGGKMRNISGKLGERKFTRGVLSALTLRGFSYFWYSSTSKTWIESSENNTGIETEVKALSWINDGRKRTAIYNRKVELVDKNIDFTLLDCDYTGINSKIANPANIMALGELKGGIDPAGADEHWKTANSALNRIRDAFSSAGFSPITFFVGAAIEKSMAEEIWKQLENQVLTNAANLTNDDQLASLCQWLINL